MAATTTLFSAPISPHLSSFASSSTAQSTKLPLIRASTSSTSTTLQDDDEQEETKSIPFGGCKACGKAEIERGCNGEGRIQGGIATVPGFGWWPIKAYRPCPDFVATGGRYRRQGQSMDEVAGFGTVPRTSSTTTTGAAAAAAETQSSNKDGPRKFKR
ncbi:hypothetical protein L6452_16361 [Arctium lappa]|uniref:Uncharacterized protein n=1 Tax=Arctium lappa TaxID=4217 RepID=A0ACB9C0A2_ARCLA|nr:hypothetical protein L6452_16361 [Arctium lappa]